jgi:hypothetical protein
MNIFLMAFREYSSKLKTSRILKSNPMPKNFQGEFSSSDITDGPEPHVISLTPGSFWAINNKDANLTRKL